MSLAEHWDESPDSSGLQYLREGRHEVNVVSHRCFKFNSGSDGVEFLLSDDNGAAAKKSFCLKGKAINWLVSFAKDCGITMDEARRYDYTKPESHSILHGKRVGIIVERLNKFCEVTGTYKPSESGSKISAPPKPSVPVASTVVEGKEEEIPF